MSNLTNYGENLTADYFRGGSGPGVLGTSFYVGLASAASDSAITELSGTGYARQAYARSLTAWAGTQFSGSTLASTGTSHSTSNNLSISFGTAGSAWGTANYVVLYDGLTGGNALAFFPITPISITTSFPVSLAPGKITCTLALIGSTNYLVNKYIDFFFRAQVYNFPGLGYFALFTDTPSNAGPGTEVAGGSYSRASIPFSFFGFSGTQGGASTVASTGTGGVIANNFSIAFPQPTANWGTIGWEGVFDSATGGNMLFWNPLDVTRTVLAGSSPQTHAIGTWTITVA